MIEEKIEAFIAAYEALLVFNEEINIYFEDGKPHNINEDWVELCWYNPSENITYSWNPDTSLYKLP